MSPLKFLLFFPSEETKLNSIQFVQVFLILCSPVNPTHEEQKEIIIYPQQKSYDYNPKLEFTFSGNILLSFIQLMVQYNPTSLSCGNSAYGIISQILVCQIYTQSPRHLSELKTVLITLDPSSNLSRSACVLSICLKQLQACCKTTILTFMPISLDFRVHHLEHIKYNFQKLSLLLPCCNTRRSQAL